MQFIPKYFRDLLDFPALTSGQGIRKKLDGTGFESFTVTATPKFKLSLMPGAAELTGASHEPVLVGLSGTNTHWSELRYNDTIINYTDWIIPPIFTSDYAGGNITVRLHWKATAIIGAVVWQIQLLGRMAGESIDAAMATARDFSATTVNGTTEFINNSELTFTPTSTELTAGDIWIIRILRKASDAGDTMSGDAKLFNAQVFEV